jgi:uncharacterized protein (TIGR03382 family)
MKTPSWLPMTVCVVMALCAPPALAEPDSFGLGNGQDGLLDVTATMSVNSYAKVTSALSVGRTSVAVDTVAGFSAGDLVMVLQTTGLEPAPGSEPSSTSVDLRTGQVGQWELARVASVAGSALTLTAPLYRAYAANVTQVIRVPEYTNVTISGTGTLVAEHAWNGATGGVVAFLANGTVSNNGLIDVSGQGFRTGVFVADSTGTAGCTGQDEPSPKGQQRGEGVAVSAYGTTGRGKVANGGGGGICDSSGGGGGGNGGAGGRGGNTYDGNRSMGGVGGGALTYSLVDRLTLGGGGGTGHGASDGTGGAGGGAIFIRARQLSGTGKLWANGASVSPPIPQADGAGGGGAGGSIYLRVVNAAACAELDAVGGAGGGSLTLSQGTESGPGGGGGGGRILFQAGAGSSCTARVVKGFGGSSRWLFPFAGSSPKGASAGEDGVTTVLAGGLQLPSTPTVTAPAQGSTTSNPKPLISGTGPANAQVYLYLEGTQLGQVTVDATGSFSFTPAADLAGGSHQLQAASEIDGLRSPLSSAITFTVDTTPPATTVDSPADGASVNTRTLAISGQGEPGSTVEVHIDGSLAGTATANGGTWSFTATGLTDGSHKVKARSVDGAGNQGPFSAEHTFTVDATPPAAPVLTVPASDAVVRDTRPTFSGTGEAGSTVTVNVDGSPAGSTAVAAAGTWSLVSSRNLTETAHVAQASASDAAGNASAPSASVNFQVDASPPAVPSILSPTAGQLLTTRLPSFTGRAEARSTVKVVLNGQDAGTVSADAAGNWSFTPATELADGAYTVQASATDAAGNSSALSAPRAFRVDATPPAAPVLTAPTHGQVLGTGTPPISGTAEPGSTVTVLINGIPMRTVTADGVGNWATTPPFVLASGFHTAQASARDDAGNVGPLSALVAFEVDTLPPGAPVLVAPVHRSLLNTPSPTVSGTAEPGSKVTVFIDNALAGPAVAVNTQGEWTFTPTAPLADGLHQVRARATDSVGNIGVYSGTHEFTLDATAPLAAAILSPANGGVVGPAFTTISGTAEPDTTVTVVLDGLSRGTAQVDVAGRWNFRLTVPVLAGPHTVKARATDAAGNAGPFSADTQFILDDIPPAVPVLVSPADGDLLNVPKPPITGMAEVGSTVTIFMNGVPLGSVLVGATGSWSFTLPLPLGDGPHEIKAQATDVNGNQGLFSLIHAFKVDTKAPPAPELAASLAGALLKTRTPEISGKAEPDSIVTILFDGAVAGTALADAAGGWSFIPPVPLADGAHRVSARARDPAGNTGVASSALTFRVDATAPQAPVVLSPVAGAVLSPGMPSFRGLAEADSLVTVFIGGTNTGTTRVDLSGSWSFTVPLTLGNGPQRMWATATDTAGNTSEESALLDFIVDAIAPAPPVVASPLDGALLNRARPSFSGRAEAHGTVSVFVDAVDVGTAAADATGAWALTSPVALADGPHQVKARVADAVGNVGTFSVTLTFAVDTVLPGVPVVMSPAQGAVLSTGTPEITGMAEPGSTVSILMGNIVQGTAPVGGSGGWIFIPSAPFAEGTWSVQALATDQAGNVGAASAARSFTVDLSPPGAPEVLTPRAGELVSTSTPVFTGTAEPGSTVTVFMDGAALGQVKADATGAWNWQVSLRVADGAHTVRAQATDAAGIVGLFSGTALFSVDTVAPDTFLAGGPAAQTELREATFELSASESGASYSCRLDGGDFAPCTSPVTFAELAEGTHTLEVRARDVAGHEDPTPARHNWAVTHREVVEGGGVGCSTQSGAVSLAPLGWLGLAWLLSRRRRS